VRQREPRRFDRPYLGFIKGLPCVGCAVAGQVNLASEAAHCKLAIAAHGWRESGVQEKSDDRKALPLCARHHRGLGGEHDTGMRAFWDRLGICPGCLAEALSAAYDAQASGSAVIWQAVRGRRRDGAPTC
jgi:hypothetical protein